MPRSTGVAVALATVALATACSTGHEDAVRDTADEFSAAVAEGDWAAACALLAPKTRSSLEQSAQKPCDQALPEEQPKQVGEPERLEVFGTTAQLRYPDETLFLTRFQDGWRVLAAVCTDRDPLPFDCQVSGG